MVIAIAELTEEKRERERERGSPADAHLLSPASSVYPEYLHYF